MDIFTTKEKFSSSQRTFQASNNNERKPDLNLDPFASLTSMEASKEGQVTAINPSTIPWPNNQHKVASSNKNEETSLFGKPVDKMNQSSNVAIDMNTTNSNPSMSFNEILNPQKTKGNTSIPFTFDEEVKKTDRIIGTGAGDISDSSNDFIADFSNLSPTPSIQCQRDLSNDMFNSTKRNTETNPLQNVVPPARNFSTNNNSISATTHSSDLFDGLQMNATPNVLMNTSNSSNDSSFLSNLNILDAKDKDNSIDSFTPYFQNSPMNFSPQQMTNVQMGHQFQSSENIVNQNSNFNNYNQNSMTRTWQPQNTPSTGMSRAPLQMQNNQRKFNPQTFSSPTPQSNLSRFQHVPVRYPSTNIMQQQRYVTPNVAHGNPSNNNFNFLSQKSGQGKRSNDTFNFVQDEMKASIKK